MMTWVNALAYFALAYFVGLLGSYILDLWMSSGGSGYVGVVIFIAISVLAVIAIAALDVDA